MSRSPVGEDRDTIVGLCAGMGKGSPVSCAVRPTGQGLDVLRENNLITHLPYQGLRLELTGLNNRYLSFQNISGDAKKVVLMVSDRRILEIIERSGAPGGVIRQLERVRRAESRMRLSGLGKVLISVFFILALIVLGVALFHGAQERVVEAIPLEWEREIGESISREMTASQRFCADPVVAKGIAEIGMRLVGALGESYYQFQVRVIDSEDVNGFAVPGGEIYLTRGLIDLANGGEEVAGVMAHEMQHVLLRHGLSNLARRAGIGLLLSTFLGDMDSLMQFFMASGAELLSLSFSREQEAEADRGALELLQQARIDARGLESFLERLEKRQKQGDQPVVFSLLSTHPSSEDRVQSLRSKIAAVPKQQVEPFKFDWSGLRMNCSSSR